MASVDGHYADLLAPVYLWMIGGIDAALAQGAADIASLGPAPSADAVAVDLGAGVGMHAIPLAKNGYDVVAIDSSPVLLAELRAQSQGLSVRAIQADLLEFRAHVGPDLALVLCMGDTLTHLADQAQVEQVFSDVAGALIAGGRFLVTFRDYSVAPVGDARFIAVRSDADRIHTCFLEEQPDTWWCTMCSTSEPARIWQMRVSSYRKLRLAPHWVVRSLERVGLTAVVEKGLRGMVRVVATKA